MKKHKKIIFVVGARPNFMKIAPLLNEVKLFNRKSSLQRLIPILVHTGQHYDKAMSDQFFKQLNISKPKYNLGVGSGSHSYQVGTTMMKFGKVLLQESPCFVVVVGDVNATIACSLTAKKMGIRVAHVEAGLRSNDWSMPEEINRVVTDRLSDLLFTTCAFADKNLRKEGLSNKKIFRVGNVMIDSLKINQEIARALCRKQIMKENLYPKQPAKKLQTSYLLMTLHRPSNVDNSETMRELTSLLKNVAKGKMLVWPLHPRTEKKLKEFKLLEKIVYDPGIILLKPLGYIEMLALSMRAEIILTDSGGLQEEALIFNVPCLTLRDNTERPMTLIKNGGTNLLVGAHVAAIKRGLNQFFKNPPQGKIPYRWDGKTAKRIIQIIAENVKD